MLEGAVALLLEDGRRNVVVQFHEASEADRAGPFDAAVVTQELCSGVRAGVVIMLPNDAGVLDVGVVTSGGRRREVELRSPQQVIDLLGHFELALGGAEPAPTGPRP